MKLASLLFASIFLHFSILAQDSTKLRNELPFHIDDSKRMPEFELSEKKEGTFVTGIPRFQFDPIRGFGIGGNAFLFINKTKDDPFFDYTAYRHRVSAEFFIFQNGRVRYSVNYDAPYIFDSKWRLRADVVLGEDPESQYWGIGRNSLNPLGIHRQKYRSIYSI